MSCLRKLFPIALVAAVACLGSAPATADETYPSRLVKVVLPFPPGSTLDALSRVMTDQMAQKWGQPVVIENITAAAAISAPTVSRARRPTATPCCSARQDRSPSIR
jgi:tripartite-type tricarboxylate transporter receptor subunit TctC